jgi:CheY-like chemotaxis protein
MAQRVLLVEDNTRTLDVLSQELRLLGYEVLTARGGEEAIAKASEEGPDLIIMDIRMPKMDGLEAVARIRSNPKTASIPILAATGKALPGDREMCLEGGCDGYLAKPFTHRELQAAIEKLLMSR